MAESSRSLSPCAIFFQDTRERYSHCDQRAFSINPFLLSRTRFLKNNCCPSSVYPLSTIQSLRFLASGRIPRQALSRLVREHRTQYQPGLDFGLTYPVRDLGFWRFPLFSLSSPIPPPHSSAFPPHILTIQRPRNSPPVVLSPPEFFSPGPSFVGVCTSVSFFPFFLEIFVSRESSPSGWPTGPRFEDFRSSDCRFF